MKGRLVLEGLSEEEAEKVLREGSREQLSGPLSDISLEVSRSIDFYKANFKEKAIAEIILAGGVSLNPGVRDFFSEAFGLPVTVPDPFKDLHLADEGMRPLGPLFAIAAGLARRQA
jgi:Tfp pilus assembly PilM family ATPase